MTLATVDSILTPMPAPLAGTVYSITTGRTGYCSIMVDYGAAGMGSIPVPAHMAGLYLPGTVVSLTIRTDGGA